MTGSDFRLILKNLPVDASEKEIRQLFEKYGTVKGVDIKEKMDFQDNKIKFAFINIVTEHKKLNSCFRHINATILRDQNLFVEVAKENFHERLKRERAEAAAERTKDKDLKTAHYEASRTRLTESNVPVFAKQSNSVIFQCDESKKGSFDVKSNAVLHVSSGDGSETSKQKRNKRSHFNTSSHEDINGKTKQMKEKVFEANGIEGRHDINGRTKRKKEKYEANNIKERRNTPTFTKNGPNNFLEQNDEVHRQAYNKESVVSEAEKKRLKSLTEKKRLFRTKEQLIRIALQKVDVGKSNKIIFSEDDEDKCNNIQSETKNRRQLFEDDEGDDDTTWNEEKFESMENTNQKLARLQSKVGNDKRFILDDRFLDDGEDIEQPGDANSDPTDEKNWQLDILSDVLGKTVKRPDKVETVPRKRMIRYDPTEGDHKEYEVKTEQSKEQSATKKKKKKKLSVTEPEESAPQPEVSKEVFYKVTDTLKDALKEKESFSLLKTLGRADTIERQEDPKNKKAKADEPFQFNKAAGKVFKYDSSDEEEEQEEEDGSNLKSITFSSGDQEESTNKFFFTADDSRFRGANEFFEVSSPAEDFKNMRRELKQIVRMKIRNNVRKELPGRRRTKRGR
ncbi:probable RNA-binding protein CG14230 [Orussus abietinus]|uniref:probable RNA-binding protein CG14230 n=1 Tax=Orussus abietinus TaxID=222816 RepID=UPI000626C562|nr:probable RNA-binding protein CG14230 [Orussus abietinus]